MINNDEVNKFNKALVNAVQKLGNNASRTEYINNLNRKIKKNEPEFKRRMFNKIKAEGTHTKAELIKIKEKYNIPD